MEGIRQHGLRGQEVEIRWEFTRATQPILPSAVLGVDPPAHLRRGWGQDLQEIIEVVAPVSSGRKCMKRGDRAEHPTESADHSANGTALPGAREGGQPAGRRSW